MPKSRKGSDLKGVSYDNVAAAKTPVTVTVVPPRNVLTDVHPALRAVMVAQDPTKRDSGLAATVSSKGAREGSVATANSSSSPGGKDHAAPQTLNLPSRHNSNDGGSLNFDNGESGSGRRSPPPSASKVPDDESAPNATSLPLDPDFGLDFMGQISFSHRGSVLLWGKKAVNGTARTNGGRTQPSLSMLSDSTAKPSLSEEIENESLRVRYLYEKGGPDDLYHNMPAIASSESLDKAQNITRPNLSEIPPGDIPSQKDGPNAAYEFKSKNEYDLAGGFEDWENVNGSDVDRYGFIVKQSALTERSDSPEQRGLHRVSTALQLASEAPRKSRVFRMSNFSEKGTDGRPSPRKPLSKPGSTQETTGSSVRRPGSFRSASNRLPGNRDRRWIDEAGDMLTLPPGLADIAEQGEGGKVAEGIKRKEWERAEKWRKMARVVKLGSGEGMEFVFDTQNPKLVERTWKGIPDRWRATAWHSFLSASAKKRKGSASDEQIIADFHVLIERASADDVQIDLDVPRTVNSHIMFRKRYHGGQRLLFRVLHCLSLYFPETGYVQGMASLAATLLCYFDEENTFVMLVRMWQLRGLEKLYAPGFAGLMVSLEEFQKDWMKGHDVAKTLDSLNIDLMTYGTRWYLTLFNYSIPFPAQLRVWDVFMLLGDATAPTKERPFGGGLDVLHATSAALMDGMRDILLDSDFERAMKGLTSWIPIRDEELFMKVAKAEWKINKGKRKV